jgi:hypothetical protein
VDVKADSNTDTIVNPKVIRDSTPDVEISLQSIIDDYKSRYKDTLKIDTTFFNENKKISILFLHFCKFDSALTIKKPYTSTFGLNSFVTHSFESTLKIYHNDSLIVDAVITKRLFNDKLFDEEKKYGVLLSPVIKFAKGVMIMHYSVSVPLTDVGMEVSLDCNYLSGRMIVEK